MTVKKRFENDPTTLTKRVAALEATLQQERAALRIRSSTLAVGGEELVNRDGLLYFRDTDQAERPVIPLPSPAPFANADFETVESSGFPASWTAGPFLTFDPVNFTTDPTVSLSGSRSLKVEVPSGGSGLRGGALTSESWLVADGATVTITAYFKASDTSRSVNLGIITNVADGVAATGAPGAIVTDSGVGVATSSTWTPITVALSMPSGHTRVAVRVIGYSSGTTAGSIWIDSVNASSGIGQHDDFTRRLQATLTLGLGGATSVDNGGLISWTGAFYASPGRQADESPTGPIVIGAMPANGTVIAVHGSNSRTTYTVASGKILLGFGETLWWRTNFGSSTGVFHIIGKNTDYTIDQGWVLICTADQFGTLGGGPVYKWGDGRTESPWNTITPASGWSIGSDGARYKLVNGTVHLDLHVLKSSWPASNLVTTLPPGFCPTMPAGNLHSFLATSGHLVRINSAGLVYMTNANFGSEGGFFTSTSFPV